MHTAYKLLILILSIFLVLCAGSCNIYPIYMHKIMTKFNFTIQDANLFGTFINIGLWVAVPMGFIFDKFGPKFSCFLGLFLLSGSYLFLHFIMNSEIFSDISIYTLLFLAFMMGQGSALLYTTSLTTNLKNFKFKENATIVGLIVSNMSISASIFTTFREHMKLLTTHNFFYILAIFLSVIILICMILFNIIEKSYSEDKFIKGYEKYKEIKIITILIYFNILILAVYIFGVIYNYYNQKYIIPLILIYPILILINFFAVLLEKFKFFDKFYFPLYKSRLTDKSRDKSIELSEEGIKNEIDFNKNPSSLSFDRINVFIQGESQIILTESSHEISFMEAIKSKNLIILFFMLILGMGSVIANLNNIHFVLKSLRVKKHLPTNSNIVIYHDNDLFIYVILYFIFNSTTRLFSGLILDYLIKIKKFFNYIFFFSFVGFFSQFLGIFMNKNLLYISISLAGASHGGYMTFTPAFSRKEYGLLNMGKILGFLTTGCAIGSFFVSDFIFIFPYEYFGVKAELNSCNGAICFYPSYMITSAFFLINIILSYILILNNQKRNITKSNLIEQRK